MTDTGLPTLPDGERWRVYHSNGFYSGYPGYLVARERSYTTPTSHLETRRKWYGKRYLVNVPGPVKRDWRTVRTTVITDDPAYLTPETIRAAADKVMALCAEDKRVNALLGTYPPKRLEANDVE